MLNNVSVRRNPSKDPATSRLVNHTNRKRSWPHVLTETVDKLIASDPGLDRFRLARSAAIGVASTLTVEYGFAKLTHAGAKGVLVSMLFGAILSMIGMMALSGTGFWSKIKTVALFPVAIGIGLLAGALVGGHTDLMLSVFVLIMFAAVAIRRFGIPYFFYGFMGWIGYFFSSFMGAKLSALPGLILAVVVATVWVMILSTTVLRARPARSLQRTMTAFDARTRAVLWTGARLLQASGGKQGERLSRRLRARQTQLSEAALIIEGWSAERGALPIASAAPRLRRRLVDTQQILDRLSGCVEVLRDAGTEARVCSATVLEYLALRRDAAAAEAAHELSAIRTTGDEGDYEDFVKNVFIQSVREFIELNLDSIFRDSDFSEIENVTPGTTVDEFEPVVGLFMGNLHSCRDHSADLLYGATALTFVTGLSFTGRSFLVYVHSPYPFAMRVSVMSPKLQSRFVSWRD